MINGPPSSDRELSRWISTPPRSAILAFIKVKDMQGASFKEIAESSGRSPTLCAYHLGLLVKSGMVRRSFYLREGRRDFSMYSITDEGRRLISLRARLEDDDRRMREHPGDPVPDVLLILSWRNMPRCLIPLKGGSFDG